MTTPTLKEQMEWLDLIKGLLHSDNEPMILAIKENLIAVRNMEVATNRVESKHLGYFVSHPDVEKTVNKYMKHVKLEDFVPINFESMGMSTDKPLLEFFEVDSDNGDTVRVSLPNLRPGEVMELISEKKLVTNAEDRIVHTIESIERYNENNPEKPFEFRSDFLNDREKAILDSRIDKLKQEIQFHLHTPKKYRSPNFLKDAQNRIDILKKWRNADSLDR